MVEDTRKHNIVVCCDGTWCGAETVTRSNIKILADAFASKGQDMCVRAEDNNEDIYNEKTKTSVCYFNGVGLNGWTDLQNKCKELLVLDKFPGLSGLVGDFVDVPKYIIDCLVAGDLSDRTKEAYRFIAKKYSEYGGPAECRVWLFGLSRGAYTARAVAGMINNCGILDFKNKLTDVEAQNAAVDRAHEIYISNKAEDKPGPAGVAAEAFRKDNSWKPGSLPPIIFMGLLDTVGAEGIPSIRFHAAPSEIWKYPYDFHDTDVSSEVQHVFQAAATHDRFAPFQPCPVRRSSALVAAGTAEEGYNKGDKYKGVKYSLREVWFPGAHYDLGRQNFVLGSNPFVNRFFRAFNPLRFNVNCTPELADYPLLGYALKAHAPPGSSGGSSSSTSASREASLVFQVNNLPGALLPALEDDDTWQTLVDGNFSNAQSWSIGGMFWGVVDSGIKLANPVLNLGGSVARALPLPQFAKLWQPPYTIDAEQIILEPLAKGVAQAMKSKPEWLLKNRHIPLPPKDNYGDITEPPKFFPVPSDTGSKNSYWSNSSEHSCRPKGRGWFMSTTYDDCQADLNRLQLAAGSSSQAAGATAAALQEQLEVADTAAARAAALAAEKDAEKKSEPHTADQAMRKVAKTGSWGK